MMAEYSRNSISIPRGQEKDSIPHFESSLVDETPYTISGDYQFVANPLFRPLRVSITNNCLTPGLWELSANDRTGEIYHGWFDLPGRLYTDLVATQNKLDPGFVKQALKWKTQAVPVRLDRLRTRETDHGTVAVKPYGENLSVGFSTQDSRRRLSGGFAMIDKDGDLVAPSLLRDLTRHWIYLADFVAPGKYSLKKRKRFDLSFLRNTQFAKVYTVTPHTSYNPQSQRTPLEDRQFRYLELEIDLKQYTLVIGNLPTALLTPQEDFKIHGFGVGILSSSEPAERRRMLMDQSPSPAYAYLIKKSEDGWMALNSHALGVEQIFIRTHSLERNPWWEVTIASFERIVDIIKYRVEIPEILQQELKIHAQNYISPLFLSYRDDNLR